MRGVRTIAVLSLLGVISACRFDPPSGTTPPDDASTDPDAVPDAPSPPFNPPCLTDPTYRNGPNGHRYKIPGPGGGTRDSGVDRCAMDGAYLAVIDSQEENDYLADLPDADGTWIGIDDLDIEMTFEWVTGATSGFRGFEGNEPNDNPVEDCVYLRDDKSWNDSNCNDSRRPICECDPTYRPPPRPACRTMQGSSNVYGRMIFVHIDPLSWTDANAVCESSGAYLMVISDDDENNAINSIFPQDVWLGYTDAAADGTFVWVNGSRSPYHKFPGGTPPTNAAENCTVLDNNGNWDDRPCTGETHQFACECDPWPP